MLQSIKKRTSNKKLFCYSISSPINRSFGALSILRDKKERVKAMGIAARLAIIPREIQNIENEKRALWENFWRQMPIFNHGVILGHLLHIQEQTRSLENRKKALLLEQQALIVEVAHRRN